MSISFRNHTISLGHTNIENSFLLKHLPHASEVDLKVYLILLMYAKAQSDMPIPAIISSISATIDISEETVISSLRYWEAEGIIILKAGDKLIEQIDLLSTQNQASFKPEINDATMIKLREIISNTRATNLNITEINYLKEFILHTHAGLDIVETVMTFYYTDYKGKTFSDIKTVLKEIGLREISDIAEVASFVKSYFRRREFYKKVMLSFTDNPNANSAQKSVIDTWILELKFKPQEVLGYINEFVPKLQRPTIANIDKLMRQKYDEINLTDEYIFKQIKLKITGLEKNPTDGEKEIFARWLRELSYEPLELLAKLDEITPKLSNPTVKKINDILNGIFNPESQTKPRKQNKYNAVPVIDNFIFDED